MSENIIQAFNEIPRAVDAHCFNAFLNIPPAQLKLVFDSYIGAFKLTMRHFSELELQILYKMLQNLELHPQTALSFYQTYFTDLLTQIFSVVTETSHIAGLAMQALILAYIIALV